MWDQKALQINWSRSIISQKSAHTVKPSEMFMDAGDVGGEQ